MFLLIKEYVIVVLILMDCIICKRNVSYNNNYCWIHFQIYEMLKKLHISVINSGEELSWKKFLEESNNTDCSKSWKFTIIDNQGHLLKGIEKVIRSELEKIGTRKIT